MPRSQKLTASAAAVMAVVLSSFVTSGHGCSLPEHHDMRESFTFCRSHLIGVFHNATLTMDREAYDRALCDLLTQIVNECGAIWQQCHTQEDISRMRSMHIQAFLEQWVNRESELANCNIVKEYRQSLSSPAPTEENACTDSQSEEMMAAMQTCSHQITANVYHQLLDQVDHPGQVKRLVCKALATIGTSCTSQLSTCLSQEDAEIAHQMHVTEMNEYFNWLLQKSNISVVVDNCNEEDELESGIAPPGTQRPEPRRDGGSYRAEEDRQHGRHRNNEERLTRPTTAATTTTTTTFSTSSSPRWNDNDDRYEVVNGGDDRPNKVYWDSDSGERVVPSGYGQEEGTRGTQQARGNNNNEYLYPTRANVGEDDRPIHGTDFVRGNRRPDHIRRGGEGTGQQQAGDASRLEGGGSGEEAAMAAVGDPNAAAAATSSLCGVAFASFVIRLLNAY